MLFNSPAFLFVFLPATLLIYWGLKAWRIDAANVWLLGASLFFYSWWEIRFLPVLLTSIAVNFALGWAMTRFSQFKYQVLTLGIVLNLAALAYFKYINFFIANAEALTGTAWVNLEVALPIGISFFTFTQIAYLVDASRSKAKEYDPVRYGLFVTYFPHLIAGPILHHGEMMPQFADSERRDRTLDVIVGLTLLSAGLFKKVVIADTIAQYSTPVFQAFDNGLRLSLLEAWIGALAYTLQIYFDFSAYCDMALGVSRMFGILLPINFLSPYQATSIIDFWRRWHITLSRFLRDYLYIPLGGNRQGTVRRYINLSLTMLLGGLWHGASWTFMLWGGLHGLYLIINHAYRALVPARTSRWSKIGDWAATFLAVVIAWIFFRAETVRGAWVMLKTMFGLRGPLLPDVLPSDATRLLGTLLLVCLAVPNIYVLMHRFEPGLYPDWFAAGDRTSVIEWRLSVAQGMCYGVLFAVAIFAMLQFARPSEFLYFQF